MTLAGDARFVGRTAAMAAYSLALYSAFEVHLRAEGHADHEPLTGEYRRRYGRHMARLFGVEVSTRGVPAQGFVGGADAQGLGRIFLCNHRSGLDILVTAMLLEGKHLSRADLAEWPLIGMLARRAGVLFVDRSSRRSSAAAVQSMITTVQQGHAIILFPEGTTYAGDEVRPFKPGAYAVAKRTGCELVPVGLAYAGGGASFEDEAFMDHMRRVAATKASHVGVSIGEPVRVEDGCEPAVFSELLRERVQAEVSRARSLVGP